MSKKCCCIVILLICMAIITGCGEKESVYENENMPEIVFGYTYRNKIEIASPYSFIYMFVDRYGNVYYGDGDDEIYFCGAEEKMQLYETLIKDDKCKKINTVDMKELHQRYDVLKQMASDKDNNVTVEESTLDVYLGQYMWSGYCYDEDDNLKKVILYGEGDTSYINSDSRAKEIADWISSLNVNN